MRENRTVNRIWVFLPLAVGAVIFILLYGVRIMDPTCEDWLLQGGDLTQHYLGWKFYRAADWQWPVSGMNNLTYPNTLSVLFMDSIPWMAFVCKLFRSVEPPIFQYFGFWGILSFSLQSFFGAKLVRDILLRREYRMAAGSFRGVAEPSKAQGREDAQSPKKRGECAGRLFSARSSVIGLYACIAGIFFTLSPVFIDRMFYHTALGSMWLLLWALDASLALVDNKEKIPAGQVIAIGMLAAGIHVYLLVMCSLILAIAFFIRIFLMKDKEGKRAFLLGIVYLAGCFAVLAFFGAFQADQRLDEGGLNDFGFNLNGLWNPMMDDWSRFLPQLSAYGKGFDEGFAYLGFGMLLLVAAAYVSMGMTGVWHFICRRKEKAAPGKHAADCVQGALKTAAEDIRGEHSAADAGGFLYSIWQRRMLTATALIFFVISLSPTVNFDAQHHLFSIPYPRFILSAWGIVRASGRFMWVTSFILMAGAVCWLFGVFQRTTAGSRAESIKEVPGQKKTGCRAEEGGRKRKGAGASLLLPCLLLCAVLALQLTDISGELERRHAKYTKEYTAVRLGESDPVWKEILKDKSKVHFIFASDVTNNQTLMYSVANCAVDYGRTTNIFYVAHDASKAGSLDGIEKELESLNDESVYVFRDYDVTLMRQIGSSLHYYRVYSGYVGLTQPLAGQTELDPWTIPISEGEKEERGL